MALVGLFSSPTQSRWLLFVAPGQRGEEQGKRQLAALFLPWGGRLLNSRPLCACRCWWRGGRLLPRGVTWRPRGWCAGSPGWVGRSVGRQQDRRTVYERLSERSLCQLSKRGGLRSRSDLVLWSGGVAKRSRASFGLVFDGCLAEAQDQATEMEHGRGELQIGLVARGCVWAR